MQVSSLEAEKATLSLHVDRTQTELSRVRTQLQDAVKESGRVKEELSEAQNLLEENSHIHKLEMTEVRMQNEMKAAEMEEVHGNLTVKVKWVCYIRRNTNLFILPNILKFQIFKTLSLDP